MEAPLRVVENRVPLQQLRLVVVVACSGPRQQQLRQHVALHPAAMSWNSIVRAAAELENSVDSEDEDDDWGLA